MTRILAGVALILAVLGGLLGWRVQTLTQDVSTLREANAGLSVALRAQQELRAVDQAAALVARKQTDELRQKQKDADARIKKAVARNRVWADADVPPDVRDALRVR